MAWWRPLKYTPEELREKALEYFKLCDETVLSIDKNSWMVTKKPKTLSWLCLYLWVDKEYISEKSKHEEFSVTIKEIRWNVENCIEEWILTWAYNPTSWIFNLKNNFDWKDKSEIDQKTEHSFPDLSEEQMKKIANQALK